MRRLLRQLLPPTNLSQNVEIGIKAKQKTATGAFVSIFPLLGRFASAAKRFIGF
jgi:hypothetical protein